MTKMKQTYNSPRAELIRTDCYMAPICVSGEDYKIEPGNFDPDSDFSILF